MHADNQAKIRIEDNPAFGLIAGPNGQYAHKGNIKNFILKAPNIFVTFAIGRKTIFYEYFGIKKLNYRTVVND
jgi:hypothetical protein